MLDLRINILRTFLNFWINANIDNFSCESVYFLLFLMMDNTPAKNDENHPKIVTSGRHFLRFPEKMPDQ